MVAKALYRSALLGILSSTMVALAVLIPAQPAAAAFTFGTGGRVNGYEAALLSYINSARVARGIPALVASAGTNDMARSWSARMASTSVLSHNPYLTTQIATSGSPNWHAVAENVGYASACSPKQLFDAYWASAGHRNNILNPKMKYVGIGTFERAASGWSCGKAWNTMNFVDSYTSTYGAARNPPQGMAIDSRVITSTESFATFETGTEPRAVTAVSGGGLSSSRPVVAVPGNGRDDAMHWYLTQTAPLLSSASLYMRDAVDLRSTRQVRMTIQVVTPNLRGVPVTVTVLRDWGTSATLGTVVADSVPRIYTFNLPTAVRGFNNTFRLTVANSGLTAVSSLLAQRTARISVYQIDLVV